jgi:hypothetical protein
MKSIILTIICILLNNAVAQANETILQQPVRWKVTDKESKTGVSTTGYWTVMPDGKIQGIQGMTRFNAQIIKKNAQTIQLRRTDMSDQRTCTYQGTIKKKSAEGHYICTDHKLYFWKAIW